MFRRSLFSAAALVVGILAQISAHADFDWSRLHELEASGPWMTGPLLTPSPTCVPFGHVNFEPYLFVTKIERAYNKEWISKKVPTIVSASFQPTLQLGIAPNFEFDIVPSVSWNHRKHQGKTVFNDFVLALAYQLFVPHHDQWYPKIKIYAQEVFPTGKYKNLDPRKHDTDIGGQGQYQTQLGIIFGKLWYFNHLHWLSHRLNISYSFAPSVHVKGFNAYGGGFGTKGTIHAGKEVRFLFSFEYSMNIHWVLSFDFDYTHINRNRFSGKRGLTETGARATVGDPPFDQFSVAPAIEYNWNQNMGLIIGPWITIAGRNAADFTSWVAAFNLYH